MSAYLYEGKIQVVDNYMYSAYPDGLQKVLKYENTQTVLSSEVLEFYKNSKDVTENPRSEKSEVFQMGLSILSLATGEIFENFYDLENAKVKFELLYEWMNKMYENKYPEPLCDILLKMLDEIPAARPSFEDIKEKLEEVTESIEWLDLTYNRKLSGKYGEDEPVFKE